MIETEPPSEAPHRRNVRLVLLNENNDLLLMKVQLPDRTFWCTIGGGVEASETIASAARRELLEETGLANDDVAWGPPVWYGEHMLQRHGVSMLHKETFVLARALRSELSTVGLTDEEKSVVKEFRWWSLDALRKTSEFVVPPRLVRYLEPLLAGAVPQEPLDIELGDELGTSQAPKAGGPSHHSGG